MGRGKRLFLRAGFWGVRIRKTYVESVYGITAAVEAAATDSPLPLPAGWTRCIQSSQDCKAGVIFLYDSP